MRFTQTALTSIDSYKLGHAAQYPEGTTKVYSNFTPRSSKHYAGKTDYIVWFGLQAFLDELVSIWQETFFDQPVEVVTSEFAATVAPFCGPNGFDVSRLVQLHKLGYLPLEIKALPEGSRVNIGIPVLTITNTVPEAFWLPNFLETWMSAELWKPSTSATVAYQYRTLINRYAAETGGSSLFTQWQAHDFSPRGMSGIADAAKSGAGALLSTTGSDNIPALKLVNDVYNGKATFVSGSVPATEHSVMCAGGKTNELETFRKLIKQYPSGVLSIVSDTWDYWKVINEIAAELQEEILARTPDEFGNAKIVFRPDSGDPVKIITGYDLLDYTSYDEAAECVTKLIASGKVNDYSAITIVQPDGSLKYCEITHQGLGKVLSLEEVLGSLDVLGAIFGFTENAKGYHTLNPRVGLIYGDSITLERAELILSRMKKYGWASDNIVFGIGSYTFQYVTRDTFGFAMKATYVEVGGQGQAIFKDPKTDDGGKRSAKGLLKVEGMSGDYRLVNDCSREQEASGCLRTVFKNGTITLRENFDTIRQRLGVQS